MTYPTEISDEQWQAALRWRPEESVEKGRWQKEVKPTGRVYSASQGFFSFLSAARGQYSDQELRTAARFPFVAGVIQTIKRDILSGRWRLNEVRPEESDEPKLALERILARPMPGESWRSFWSKQIENLLVIGRFDAELLRPRGGTVKKALEDFAQGRLSGNLAEAVKKARNQRGGIVGLAYYDPATIQSMRGENGVFQEPAFYQVGDYGLRRGTFVKPKPDMPHWSAEDFVEVLWSPAVESDKYGQGDSPVEFAYPLIDILWHFLNFTNIRLKNPTIDKLISLYSEHPPLPLRSKQVSDIVEGVREDIKAGRPVVVEGVKADVADLGTAVRWEEYLPLVQEFQLILWSIIGIGAVEMGKVDQTARATAESQIAASQRQAIGVIRSVIKDFVDQYICLDSYSDFSNLRFDWMPVEHRFTAREAWQYQIPIALEMGVLTSEEVKDMFWPELKGLGQAPGVEEKVQKTEKVTVQGVPLTAEELMAKAEITEEDIETAGRRWRKVMPDKAKLLLEAEREA